MRTNAARARGSVLVLAVGLLTILVMLGAAFLLMSNLDASQADAVADAGEIDPVAEGIAARLRGILARHLYLGSDGPYSGLTGSKSDKWRRYAGYPGDDGQANEHLDAEFLYYNDGVRWHLSELDGFGRTGILADPPSGVTPYDSDGAGGDDCYVTDTDGDGTADAYLLRTGVYTEQGREYFAAVKVVNLDGKLCLNTAGPGAPDAGMTMPPTVRPVNVDLEAYLGSTRYNRLHFRGDDNAGRGARWQEAPDLDGDGSADPDDFGYYGQFSPRFAERLFEPDVSGGNYRFVPFGPGEEVFLRWLGDQTLTQTGRVRHLTAAVPGGTPVLPASYRRHLTAYNVCRSLMRPPPDPEPPQGPRPGTPAPDWEGDARPQPLRLDQADLSTQAQRQAVYERMLTMLAHAYDAAPNAAMKQWAAHFVANLWAYQSSGGTDAPWAFSPTGETFTVFGLVQDLVFTEAYAAHKGAVDPANHNWAYAIEILNPTDQNVNVTANYHLRVDGEDKDWGGRTFSIPPGNRVVLYSIRDSATSNELGLPKPIPAGWQEVSHVSFKDGQTIRLVRNDGDVPVDKVSAADLEYDGDIPDTDTLEKWDIRRDDDPSRYRFNIAAYKDYDSQALGLANGLTESDLAQDRCAVWIARAQQPLRTLGELGRIYMTGPYRAGTTYASFPERLQEPTFKPAFGDAPGRGRLALGQGDWGVLGPNYPDVPLACLAEEFFSLVPTDATRSDDPRRVYGRVNLNTAPPEVLAALPWPDSMTVDGTTYGLDTRELVAFIVAYRDGQHPKEYAPALNNQVVNDYFDYSSHTRETISGMSRLRTQSEHPGYLTPGEVAVPLADYVRYRILRAKAGVVEEMEKVRRLAGYTNARDKLLRVAANLVTVRGEAYAATIRLFVPNQTGGYDSRYYLVEYDTSNCTEDGDLPRLLVFTRLQ